MVATDSFTEVVARLHAAQEDARKQNIADWAQSRQREHLKILSIVYRHDDDPDLQSLAIAAEQKAANMARYGTYADRDVRYLGDASSAYTLGDRVKAIDYLNKALDENDDLRTDRVIADFGALIMQVDPDRALMMLNAPESLDGFSVSRGANYWWDGSAEGDEVDERTLLIQIVVYTLSVTAAFTGVAYALAVVWARQYSALQRLASQQAAFMGNQPFSIRELIVIGLSGLLAVGLLFLHTYAVHFVANVFMNGLGSYKGLLRRMLQWRTWLDAALLVIVAALLVVTTAGAAGASDLPTLGSTIRRAATLTRNVWIIGVLGSVLALSGVVSGCYRMSGMKGLVAYLSGSFLTGVLISAVALVVWGTYMVLSMLAG